MHAHPTPFTQTTDRELWYDDGNVVLVAGDVGFRVYKGLLSSWSTVFAGILEQLSTETAERFDDCDVVRLADDTPDDWASLLGLIMHYSGMSRPARIPVVAGRVRLAIKYKIDSVLAHAIWQLKSCFSDDPDAWRAAVRRDATYSPLDVRPDDAIAVARLARLTDTPSILPAALYMCCRLPARTLLRGVALPDGATEKLDEGDVIRCLDARPALARQDVLATLEVWQPPLDGRACALSPCGRAVAERAHLAREGRPPVVCTLSTTLEDLVGGTDLCAGCREQVRGRLEAVRRRQWADLPRLFALGVDSFAQRADEAPLECGDAAGGAREDAGQHEN